MATARDIRSKINSIKNTQKITRAMEMVAASKMRKAQNRMFATRPYAEKILKVIGHLAKAHPEYRHEYLAKRELKRVGLIIVSTDRGLCGGLNANLFRATAQNIRQWREQGIEVDICPIGTKALNFFKRFGGHVVAHASHLGDTPSISDLIGVVKIMLDAYAEEKIDGLYIAYNDFVNTMTQRPELKQLLPLVPTITENDKNKEKEQRIWDYIYEPDAKELITLLLGRYIESQTYQAVVENAACEQAARMIAMKNATENAGELINDLWLIYNKARQAGITREISEIVAGAAAV